jgi:hypothetical protein
MKSNAQNYSARSITEILIHPVNTTFDLAGMILSCLPDASVLLTAVSGITLMPA